jgi:hypothetical protein
VARLILLIVFAKCTSTFTIAQTAPRGFFCALTTPSGRQFSALERLSRPRQDSMATPGNFGGGSTGPAARTRFSGHNEGATKCTGARARPEP